MANSEKGTRRLVVIGGSAGALEALKELLSLLPEDFPAPILIVVHIPNEFPSYLAGILGRAGSLPATEVHGRERLHLAHVYIAPPDRHMLVEDGWVEATRGPRENRHRPAIDPLFRTAAHAHGRRVIGIVLSGNLDDGSSGLMAVKIAGGLAVVQDRREAICPEMPTRAKQYAKADYELTVKEIAELLVKQTSGASEGGVRGGEVAMADIAREGEKARLEFDANREKAGKPSAMSCPECGGVLWEVEEGELLRYRCRVGHAYTADSLRTEMTEAVEAALWASMRALEEKGALLRRLADRSGERLGREYTQEAKGYDKHVQTLRQVLISNEGLQDEEEHAAD